MVRPLLKRFLSVGRKLTVTAACLTALYSANAQPANYPPPTSCTTNVSGDINLNSLAGLDLLGTYNGHTYYITEGFYFGNQIAATVSGIGAALFPGQQVYPAAIVNRAENDFITCHVLAYNQLKYGAVAPPVASSVLYQNPQPGAKSSFENWGDVRNPWIGFTDASKEGEFVWSNGQPNCENYTNWNVREPNNYTGQLVPNGEDFTQLLIMEPYNFSHPDGPPPFLNDPLGRWNDWFNELIINNNPPPSDRGNTRLPIIIEVGPADCAPPPPPTGNEGCTPGYWKNHTGSWVGTGFSPGQTAGSVFALGGFPSLASKTLLQTLQGGGGPGTLGAATILLRAAVAALLNAGHPNVDYPRTTAQIIADVNAALASNNRDTMLALATALDNDNNLGCPIDAHNNPTSRAPIGGLPSVSLDKAFAISGYPNPTRSNFSLRIDGASTEKVTIRVTDITGRLIEQRTNVAANQVISIGNNYQAGMYYVEVMQAGAKKQLKLVKQ